MKALGILRKAALSGNNEPFSLTFIDYEATRARIEAIELEEAEATTAAGSLASSETEAAAKTGLKGKGSRKTTKKAVKKKKKKAESDTLGGPAYHPVSYRAMLLCVAVLSSVCVFVLIRLATWGTCANPGMQQACVTRTFPIFGPIGGNTTACACSSFVHADTTCPDPPDVRQRFINIYIQCSEIFTLRCEKLHTET